MTRLDKVCIHPVYYHSTFKQIYSSGRREEIITTLVPATASCTWDSNFGTVTINPASDKSSWRLISPVIEKKKNLLITTILGLAKLHMVKCRLYFHNDI